MLPILNTEGANISSKTFGLKCTGVSKEKLVKTNDATVNPFKLHI